MGRRPNTRERRAQVVDALIDVMAERGYEGASVAAVAARAGLTAGLLHYHFESKQAILLAVIEELTGRHLARLDEHLSSAAGRPLEQLAALLDLHLAAGADADAKGLACWIVIGAEALRQPEVQGAYRQTLEEITKRLAAVVQAGIEQGVFQCADARSATAAMMALIQGYYALAATARETIPRGSAATAARDMARGLLGISPGRRGGGRR
jgi:TetR/AcrR family transcriptional repressor of bet genes